MVQLWKTTRFALQRQRWLRPTGFALESVACKSQPAPFSYLEVQRSRRRRFATDTSRQNGNDGPQSSRHSNDQQRKNLEKFTAYILDSRRAPLGTLTTQQWDDLVAATDAWLSQAKTFGISVDTAERLLQRLASEQAASSDVGALAIIPRWQSRQASVDELRRSILLSRLHILRKHSESSLALERTEKSFLAVCDWDTTGQDPTFSESLATLLDSWIKSKTIEGAQRGCQLLLHCTDECHRDYVGNQTELIIPFFNQILFRLLSLGPRGSPLSSDANVNPSQILERMESLKQEKAWETLELSEQTQDLLIGLESENIDLNLDSNDDESPKEAASLSSFEAEALEKRAIDLLRGAHEQDLSEVSKLVKRLEIYDEVSDQVLLALVDYYLRIGDAERVSAWVPKISSDALLAVEEDGTTRLDKILDCWAHQTHPRAPWRVEEIFREIYNNLEGEEFIHVDTVNRLLSIWSQSSDLAGDRKVREWFSIMKDEMKLEPNAKSLALAVGALGENASFAESVFSSIADQWGSMTSEDKVDIAEHCIHALNSTPRLRASILPILSRLREQSAALPREKYQSIVRQVFEQAEPAAVLDLVNQLAEGASKSDLILYQGAIQRLLQFDREHLDDVKMLWKSVFDSLLERPLNSETELIADFLQGVTKMYTYRKYYGEASHFLTEAERYFMNESFLTRGVSLIPLECYRQAISRKWYTTKNAAPAVKAFERLLSLYEMGYTNLLPDARLYNDYIRARTIQMNSPKDLEDILEQMLHLKTRTNSEALKPDASTFNSILLAYTSGKDSSSEAYEASLALWNRMLELEVAPDSKTVALVIQAIATSAPDNDVYRQTMEVYQKLEDFNLEANSRILHSVMAASSKALVSNGTTNSRKKKNAQNDDPEREQALKVCLRAFGEIREKGYTNPATYATLTRSLRRLVPRGEVADKVAASTLLLCYDDGLLGPRVKDAYRAIMSRPLWKKHYTDRLFDDQQEPVEWTRGLQMEAINQN